MDCINSSGREVIGMKPFRLMQLLLTIGLILGLVGGTSAPSPSPSDPHPSPPAEAKAGIILYIVAFAAEIIVAFVAVGHKALIPKRERKIYIAIFVSLPLIAVRLAYSVISSFANDSDFSVIGGSIIIRAFMASIEEMLVVLMYIGLGFMLESLGAEQRGELAHREWRDRGSRAGRGERKKHRDQNV